MKYILANNATATLSASITDSETSLVLADIAATLATALGAVDASHRILLTLADLSEAAHEIVEVTAWNAGTSTATITRAQDGTTAAEWPVAGSKAEVRTGRQVLGNLWTDEGANSVGIRGYAQEADSVAIGQSAYAGSTNSLAVGKSASAQGGDDAICIGSGYSGATRSIAIGKNSDSQGVDSVAIGPCQAGGARSVSVGAGAESWEDDTICLRGKAYSASSMAIGISAQVYASNAIALGNGADAQGASSVCIGHATEISGGVGNIAIGHESQSSALHGISIGTKIENYADFGVMLGRQAYGSSPHFSHMAFLPCHPATSWLSYAGTLHANDIATRHRAAPMMTLATGIINLANDTSAYEVEIPSGVRFFADRIDVVITSATSPSGSPAITVGTTAGGTDILAATAITKTAAHQRQQITPDNADGVTSIHVKTSTAGTGTLTCRVVLVGYLVADE